MEQQSPLKTEQTRPLTTEQQSPLETPRPAHVACSASRQAAVATAVYP